MTKSTHDLVVEAHDALVGGNVVLGDEKQDVALAEVFGDLIDMHDVGAIDLGQWPTVRKFAEVLIRPEVDAPCCPDPACPGNPCTFPGYADNH